MTPLISNQCTQCKHLGDPGSLPGLKTPCAAFPDGIPDNIARGRFDHRNSHPGDHSIRFEAKNERQTGD